MKLTAGTAATWRHARRVDLARVRIPLRESGCRIQKRMVEEVDDLRALGLRVVGFVGFWGSNSKALRGKRFITP